MDFATRYDLLKNVVSRYDGYYHLSAIKASLLLTTNAILLTLVVSKESGVIDGLGVASIPLAFVALAALLSLVSIGFSTLVIASYLGSRRSGPVLPSVTFSWDVAGTGLDDYRKRIDELTEQTLLDDLARLAHELAVGLTRKFRRINLSLMALAGAIACGVLAYLSLLIER